MAFEEGTGLPEHCEHLIGGHPRLLEDMASLV